MTTATPQERMLALANAYYATFTTESGAEVLADLKARAYFGKTIMAAPAPGQPLDVPRTMLNEGKRVMLLEILVEIERGRRGLMPVGQAKTQENGHDG